MSVANELTGWRKQYQDWLVGADCCEEHGLKPAAEKLRADAAELLERGTAYERYLESRGARLSTPRTRGLGATAIGVTPTTDYMTPDELATYVAGRYGTFPNMGDDDE